MNYFDSPDFLEPKCSKCSMILDYGANTKYNDELMAHVCLNCGNILK